MGVYLQYPTPPKPADQARREPRNCVNPAEYLQYHTQPGPIYPEMSPAVGILEAMGRVVHFPPAASPDPAPGHPVRHVPSLAGAVEAYFANRDLAAETRHTYRKALDPLAEAAGGDRPVIDLDR